MKRTWGAIVVAALVSGSGCDSIPAPGGLEGWNVGDSKSVGACDVRLLRAAYYHSDSWNLEVTVEVSNRGAEEARCGWEAMLVSGTKVGLTESVGAPQSVLPDESLELSRAAREANLTGFSGGPSEGDWVLMTLTEGMPVLGGSQQFHATPDRIRPPG